MCHVKWKWNQSESESERTRELINVPCSGIAAKVENRGQYDEYVKELQPIREELGVNLKEQMYPDGTSGEHLGAAKGIE